jgi:hypothetical protein
MTLRELVERCEQMKELGSTTSQTFSLIQKLHTPMRMTVSGGRFDAAVEITEIPEGAAQLDDAIREHTLYSVEIRYHNAGAYRIGFIILY